MNRGAAVDDQRNAAFQFRRDVGGSRGTDSTETICAWRRDWAIKETDDLLENRMGTDSQSDCFQSRCDNVGNDFLTREHQCEWSRPETVEEQVDQLFIARWDCSHALKPIAVRQVNDEWIEPRPFFRFENLKRCIDIQRVGAKPIDRFRGKRDRFASTKMCNRCADCRSKLLRCPCGKDIRRHFADR